MDTGEPSLLALPNGWPFGERVPVILTPKGPQKERVLEPPAWESANLGISFGQASWHPSLCACISIEAAWGLHSSRTLQRLQKMQPGVKFHWKSSFCMGSPCLYGAELNSSSWAGAGWSVLKSPVLTYGICICIRSNIQDTVRL